ncbi:hypothetical protein N1851_011791 [Merluccius polli]|uniref:Uncharacterized protein n=1 Tax=Merluccius polli TaxID=89951 RepID=A0AA47ME17_MERPO|nr:hypothetical protein N1851_024910 [Merluccius polli]KAK0148277.1 hypothetical protein N1851_011791 [Merluccius polli]
MSTSVAVTFLPSMTRQSLQSLAKFFPFISFPVALGSPCTANFLKETSASETDAELSAMLKCQTILDDIAPIKMKQVKHNALPWLNNHTRTLKRQWKRAERKWKKD